MRRSLVILLCILSSGCFDKTDGEIQTDARQAVKKALSSQNPKEPCATMKLNKYTLFGNDAEKQVMHLCGDRFDTEKELVISNVKIKRGEVLSLCGIVSGTSLANSKIGQRFIYVKSKTEYTHLKPALRRHGKDEVPPLLLQSLESFSELEREFCN